MRFFFDRCMPIRIARMVSAYEARHTVRHHDDDNRFHDRTTDVEWIAALKSDGLDWIVVSGDANILRNKVESEAMAASGLKFVCMGKAWMSMKFAELAWKFIKVWPEIVEAVEHGKAKVYEVAGGKAMKVEPK